MRVDWDKMDMSAVGSVTVTLSVAILGGRYFLSRLPASVDRNRVELLLVFDCLGLTFPQSEVFRRLPLVSDLLPASNRLCEISGEVL